MYFKAQISRTKRVLERGLERQYLQVNIMLHQSHPSISGPALLIVVAHYVLVVGIRMLSKVALDQISCLISGKPEKTRKSVQFHFKGHYLQLAILKLCNTHWSLRSQEQFYIYYTQCNLYMFTPYVQCMLFHSTY